GRTIAGLWAPLDYQQGAPYGFLIVERIALLAFGPGEWALRLLPFVASLAVLVLVCQVSRAHLGGVESVVAVGAAALMPALIYYSAEAKQYALDLAVSLALVSLAASALRRGLTIRRAVTLAIAGAGAVWFSHPAPFVLAGVGTTLFCHEVSQRRWD